MRQTPGRRRVAITGATGLTLLGLAAPAAITARADTGTSVCGRIAPSTTWNAAGSPYRICADGATLDGGSLTLDGSGGPVAVVASSATGGFNVVDGSLTTAHTSSAAPVTFDGPTATAGSWPGITLREDNQIFSGQTLNVAYVSVAHAATGVTVDTPAAGVVATLDHLTVTDSSADGVDVRGPAQVTAATLQRIGGDGIYGDGFQGDPLTVTDSTIDHAARSGIFLGARDNGADYSCTGNSPAAFSIARNVVTASGTAAPGYPAMVADESAVPPAGSSDGNTGGNNFLDAIDVRDCLRHDATWVTPVQSTAVHPLGYVTTGLMVGARLTVPAGAVVKGGPAVWVEATRHPALDVSGSLDAGAGGAVFTSLSDNASGVALCPSWLVSTCSPTPGDFGGIGVSGSLTLGGATVQYADTAVAEHGAGASSQISNTTITASGTGISGGPVTVTGGSITAQGRAVDSSGVTMSGVQVTAGGDIAVLSDGGSTSLVGNSIHGGTAQGINVLGTNPVVRDNTVTGAGIAIALDGSPETLSLGPGAGVDGNTGSGNGADVVAIAGTITNSFTWLSPATNSSPSQPLGYIGAGPITLPGPLTLTVPAGGVVKAAGITLAGATLDASAGGAVFALPGDDTVAPAVSGRMPSTGLAGLSLVSSSDGSSHGNADIHAATMHDGWSVSMSSGATSTVGSTQYGLVLDGVDMQAGIDRTMPSYLGSGAHLVPAVTVSTGTAMLSCDRIESNAFGAQAFGAGTTITQSDLDGNAGSFSDGTQRYDLYAQAAVSAEQVWWGQPGGPVNGQIDDVGGAPVDTGNPLAAPAACAPSAATPIAQASTASSLDLGAQLPGSNFTNWGQIAVRADGSRDSRVTGLRLSGTNAADFTATMGSCQNTRMAPGDVCPVTVGFKPTASGQRQATLTITDNSAAGSYQVTLTGTGGLGPRVTLSPSSLDFGAVLNGLTSPTQTVTVTNTGDAPLSGFYAVTIGPGGTSAAFSVVDDACAHVSAVPPGASCTISVVYQPFGSGLETAQLNVSSNDPRGTATAALTGTSVARDTMQVAPAPLDFGRVDDGTSADGTISLTNSSLRDEVVDQLPGPYYDSAFSLAPGDTCSDQLIHPGGSCHVVIQFAPVAPAGAHSATLQVSFSDGAWFDIAMQGTGVGPITLSPPSIDFGPQPLLSQSAPRTLTVTDTGVVPLHITSVTLGAGPLPPPLPQEFHIVSDACTGIDLSPGGSCQVAVTFSPLLLGSRASQLTLVDSAPGGTQTVPLTGDGVLPV